MSDQAKGHLGENCSHCPNVEFCANIEFVDVLIDGKNVPIPDVLDLPQVVKAANDAGFKTVMSRVINGMIVFDPSVRVHKLRAWLKHSTDILDRFAIVEGSYTQIINPDSIGTRMMYPDDPAFKGKEVPTVYLVHKDCLD